MGKFKNSDIIIIIVLPTPLLDNQKDRFSEKWATIDLGCLSVFRCAVFVWGPAASDLGSGRSRRLFVFCPEDTEEAGAPGSVESKLSRGHCKKGAWSSARTGADISLSEVACTTHDRRGS